MTQPSAHEGTGGVLAAGRLGSTIAVDHLTKRFGEVVAVDDLSFTVEPGRVTGFLGPNGAGKTTTIRTLLDLLHPTSGTASILGLDSRRDSLAVRARIGNLAGDFTCDPRLTGRELLEFAARCSSQKLLLNFEAVKFLSSAMLGKLIWLHKKALPLGGRLAGGL